MGRSFSGIALRAPGVHQTVFENISEAITRVVRWINQPRTGSASSGLVYTSVSTSGLEIFTSYGAIILLLVGCMLLIALVVNPIIVFVCIRKNPYPLVLRCLKDSGITAFFTRSSAANIPVNMELCQNLGLNKDNYSVSIPLGATINMAGAAVTISIMTMATVHLLGIQVDFPTAVVLSILSAVGACGASGVAGGSLLLIPLACSLFGIGQISPCRSSPSASSSASSRTPARRRSTPPLTCCSRASAEYMARRKKGIEFFPGKDAPLPSRRSRRTSSTRHSSKALRTLGPPRRSGRGFLAVAYS